MISGRSSQTRGFAFWALAPLLLVFLIAMPFLVPKRDAAAIIALCTIELFALLMLLGLFDADRFWWAWRGLGAIVFLGYLAYVVTMLIENGGQLEIRPLLFIGLPGLWYALFGRFSYREDATDCVDQLSFLPQDEYSQDDSEDEASRHE